MTNPDQNNLSVESCNPPHPGEDIPDLSILREEKGFSLADVFTKTRISTKNLAALERGDFAALPPAVYTKAFIRQYAELLGIDPQPILLKYATYLKTLEDPQPIRKKEDKEAPTQKKISVKKLAGGLVLLAVVISLIFFIYNQNEGQPEGFSGENTSRDVEVKTIPSDNTGSELVTSPGAPETSTQVPVPAESVLPNTVTSPVQPSNVTPPPQTVRVPVDTATANASQRLTIKAREISWIGIRIDQQARQQVMLHPGDIVTYEGTRFRLDIGNAGGVDVFLADKLHPPLGDHGQVVHVDLP